MARTRTLSSEGAAAYVSLKSWPGEEDVPPVTKPAQPADVNPWSIAKLAATQAVPVRPVRGGSSSPTPQPSGVRCHDLDSKTGRAAIQGNASTLANVTMEGQESPSRSPLVHLADRRHMFMPTIHDSFDSLEHDEIPALQGPPTAVTLATQDVPATQGGCYRMEGYAPHHRAFENISEAASSRRMALVNNMAAVPRPSQAMVPTDTGIIYHTPPPSAGRKRPMEKGHNPPYRMPARTNPKRKLPNKVSTTRKPRTGPESALCSPPCDVESLQGPGALAALGDSPNAYWSLPARQHLDTHEDAQIQTIVPASRLPCSLQSEAGRGRLGEQPPDRSHGSTMADDDLRRYLTKRQRSVVTSGSTIPKRLKSSILSLEDITEGALSLQMYPRPVDAEALKPLIDMLAPYETYVINGITEPGLPIRSWELEDVDRKLRKATADWVHETLGVRLELEFTLGAQMKGKGKDVMCGG
ncbi:hypothetical protein ACRALDRAFT_2059382 [Sodiomyces alcalophilus JCM 7366]|uniref:uncharacterized protein n=1 Tax=Sodiomyces alcalophilus JCM 7366 TaxID=591952 RepID=UPI0039B443CF